MSLLRQRAPKLDTQSKYCYGRLIAACLLLTMVSDSPMSSEQSGFFSHSGELEGTNPQFTEICTALYERELLNIAHNGPSNVSILRRRLAGLPHHIRSVARYLVSHSTPLDVDAHNGSWFLKQPAKCPGLTQTAESCNTWYQKNAQWGLVIPILVKSLEGSHIELDSIDKVQWENQTLHANLHGWFTFEGIGLNNETLCFSEKTLLKPSKAIMASACCGHTWRHKSKGMPRALSLREMRLSTNIEWRTFKLAKNE